MSDIRTIRTPNDFGPKNQARARISRAGLGSRLIHKGNPYSYVVDWLGECLPFLSLHGGQDEASKLVRAQALQDQEDARAQVLSGGGGPGASTTGPASPTAPAAGAGPDTKTAAAVDPKAAKYAGPFGYIALADDTRGKK
jgi:hypothetical protein